MRAPPTPRNRTSAPDQPAQRRHEPGSRAESPELLAGDEENCERSGAAAAADAVKRRARPSPAADDEEPSVSASSDVSSRSTIITRPASTTMPGETRCRGGSNRCRTDGRHVDAEILLRLGAFAENTRPPSPPHPPGGAELADALEHPVGSFGASSATIRPLTATAAWPASSLPMPRAAPHRLSASR